MKKAFSVLALFLLLLTISCGGGSSSSGGGESTPTPTPQLKSFSISPTSAKTNVAVTLTINFKFTDSDGDLDGGFFNYSFGPLSGKIQLASSFKGLTSGSGGGPFNLTSTGSANATYTFRGWLTDKTGKNSNNLDATFVVGTGGISIGGTGINTNTSVDVGGGIGAGGGI